MEKENNNMCSCEHNHGKMGKYMFKRTTGGIYGLAFIGAAVYYIQQATSFWMGVLGILKAIVWPAMLIYKLFGFLGM